MIEYPMVSKQIKLTNDCILGIDQTSSSEDTTCLCFARLKEDKINILDCKHIAKQKDIDEYINMNMKEIYRVFGLSLEELGGEYKNGIHSSRTISRAT